MVTQIGTDEARQHVDAGAQLLEVLPADEYRSEHLPGAVNIPLTELTREAAERQLDPSRPTVVYCFDLQCDLSARGAARLEQFGFTDVFDYAGSKAAWLARGLPAEGSTRPEQRVGAVARPAATCSPDTGLDGLPEPGPGGVVLVVEDGVVLGAVEPGRVAGAAAAATAVDVAHPGPVSVRPSITIDELARSMDQAGDGWTIVSTDEGRLLGIVERGDLGVDR